MKPIVSLRDLSSRLGFSLEQLRAIAVDPRPHYKLRSLIDKKNPNIARHLKVPIGDLKEIQRRIAKNILSRIDLVPSVHGGVAGKSPRTNARTHLGQRCLINLDVEHYFPNVRHYMVYRMFQTDLRFGRDVASLLTKLTTLESELPQGAPTSTHIANILLAKCFDAPVLDRANRSGFRLTRFVDDIAISGSNPRGLINEVAKRLSRKRLQMHRRKARFQSKPKLKIVPNSRRQEVTGLVVNSSKGLSVAKNRRDAIRAAIFALRHTTGLRTADENSIRGRIAYVLPFNPGAARRLEQMLDKALAG